MQLADYSISQSFVTAAAKVDMIEGWAGKDARPDDLLPPAGITACRAALGQYLASQGMSLIAADTSILASYTNEATYGLITRIQGDPHRS